MKRISRNEEFHFSCSFQNTFFWRIYMLKFWTRAPRGPKSFNFMPFLEHLQNHMLAPREWLVPPPRGNLGSATDCSPPRMHNSLSMPQGLFYSKAFKEIYEMNMMVYLYEERSCPSVSSSQ